MLEGIARLAERSNLVVFSDEIYDQMTYEGNEFIPMATLVQRHAVLPRWRASRRSIGRVAIASGWVSFAGRKSGAAEYFAALELLSSLRLCSNVPAQWAVQTALGGYQSIKDLVTPAAACTNHGAPSRMRKRPVASSTCSHGACDVRVHRREDRRAAGLR